ncbi:MAG: hypothetical protein MJ130_07290 [Lachnospiraceae bacterium]|nr:hypothetical protein [Lachnospiraceae bacterium]
MTKELVTYLITTIDHEINQIQKRLVALPKGKLSIYRNGQYTKWVHINNNQQSIISKKDRIHAQEILLQEYLQARLSDLMHEKAMLQNCLKQITLHKSEVDFFWNKKYLSSFFQNQSSTKLLSNNQVQVNSSSTLPSKSEEIFTGTTNDQYWHGIPYIKNSQYPEQLIYPSISGNNLRSKSEVIIDQTMYFNKIDYRYECQMILNDIVLYPDFIAISKSSHQLIIWEHLGMMDTTQYMNNAISKIALYIKNGYIPGINLIITSETSQIPLNPLLVNDYVQRFLM